MSDITIRPADSDDLTRIKEIAVLTKMFSVDEVEWFNEMFAGALDGSMEGHQWLVTENANGEVVAAAQYAPEPFADRMWNVYFLAVDPNHHGSGIGGALIAQIEADLSQLGHDQARTVVVETSSTEQYARTRDFYASLGYDEEARIRQFYGPEDHKVIFWKQLA